jgi:hypothetical protein
VGSADLPSAGAFASICVDCKLACSIAPCAKALFKTRYEGQIFLFLFFLHCAENTRILWVFLSVLRPTASMASGPCSPTKILIRGWLMCSDTTSCTVVRVFVILEPCRFIFYGIFLEPPKPLGLAAKERCGAARVAPTLGLQRRLRFAIIAQLPTPGSSFPPETHTTAFWQCFFRNHNCFYKTIKRAGLIRQSPPHCCLAKRRSHFVLRGLSLL